MQHVPDQTPVAVETLIAREDFTLAANTGAGALQTIATHIVPRGEARALLRLPGRLHLGALEEFDGDAVTTDFALSSPASVAASPRNFPVPVKAFVDGVAQTYTTGSPGAGEYSFTAATGTISFGTAPASGTDNVDIYYPFTPGRWSIEIFSANERRHETYGNGAVRRVNIAPQDDVNSAFSINNNTPFLPQDYIVRVQLDSANVVNWDAANPYSEIELPYTRKPLGAMSAGEIESAGHLIGA